MSMQLDHQNQNVNIDGSIDKYYDFGGYDTYTISSALSEDVIINDNQVSRINLPVGLHVSAARFANSGVEFTIGDATLTLLGDPHAFEFVFGGNPIDPTQGTVLDFDQTAAAFGLTLPTEDGVILSATRTGYIQSNGTVGHIVHVDGPNTTPFDAATGDWTFQIAPGVYAYTIDGFGAGDRLDVPDSNFATVRNEDYTDDRVVVQWADAGAVVRVELIGLANGIDGQLSTLAAFETVFGAGTLA